MSNALAQAFECEISDDTLIARVLAGDTQLFAVLVRRYNQRLFRVARAIVTNDADAEDALQQTYLAAFRKLGTFEGRSRVSTWLIRIAIREALAKRQQSRTTRGDLIATAVAHPAPEESAMDREMVRLVEAAIDELPDAYRLVFVLRAVQGMSTTEVADALALSEENVRVRLHRGRDMLKSRLRPHIDPSDAYWFAGKRCGSMVIGVMLRVLTRPS
ncbi:MAG TPA: RNA polymerase sigma factor [Polyangiaceae bacterium]|nr:RNA polymerase sigma factor [Polyangiaceae bacterium]